MSGFLLGLTIGLGFAFLAVIVLLNMQTSLRRCLKPDALDAHYKSQGE